MTDRNQHELQERMHRRKGSSESLPMTGQAIHLWIQQARSELWQNIMPFWTRHSVDSVHGGFIGRMSNDLVVDSNAAKGLVLNARLLWSFSAMHRFTKNPDCLKLAHRAYDYILRHFWDAEHEGAFWNLHPDGRPLNTCKKTYGHAFLIYAMAEYYQCTGKEEALKKAQQVFGLLEDHAFDPADLGYFDAYNRNWTLADDQRLGDEDMNEKKSMNNHLHLLEAFSNLYRVWKHPQVADRLKMLIDLFCEKILNSENGHLVLFFDETWNRKSQIVSFGHDIEASWLLCEAAKVLEDPILLEKTELLGARIAQTVYEEAVDSRGGMCHEVDPAGQFNRSKEFWCQAEAVVGFLNAYQLTQKKHFYDAAVQVWEFIRNTQADREHGEWFLRIDPENRPVLSLPKISEWKDPYHNGRSCMEMIQRLSSLIKVPVQYGKEAAAYEER
jgi:mannobiose 2-epimerase